MSDKANETTTQTGSGSGSSQGQQGVPDIPIGNQQGATIRGIEEPPVPPVPVPGGGKVLVKKG